MTAVSADSRAPTDVCTDSLSFLQALLDGLTVVSPAEALSVPSGSSQTSYVRSSLENPAKSSPVVVKTTFRLSHCLSTPGSLQLPAAAAPCCMHDRLWHLPVPLTHCYLTVTLGRGLHPREVATHQNLLYGFKQKGSGGTEELEGCWWGRNRVQKAKRGHGSLGGLHHHWAAAPWDKASATVTQLAVRGS